MKKGFTLVEILIVLLIMGILAVLVVPTLTMNYQNASFKAAYKRAYNIMSTIIGMEISQCDFPFTPSGEENESYLKPMHDAIIRNVSFRDYYDEESAQTLYALPEEPKYENLWINTEDGLSYKVQGTSSTQRSKKSTINSLSTMEELAENALYYITIDVNGYKKGPNCEDPKTQTGLEEDENFNELTCDRYPIFIAIDGTAAGHRKRTITGRILSETNF